MKQLKKRKAEDNQGWNNELLIRRGKEMVKSLHLMFNRILKEGEIPEQWEEMRIKSIFKKKDQESS